MIKIFLFIILGYYILKFVFPFLLRYIISRLTRNVQKEFGKRSSEDTKKNKPKSSNIGEYVDYEEID
jgi:hypothetical protein|tara:strand:- start:3414 stop:3614 length:201 start_codon:yes stop_codon:yes gene_type:complete